MRYFEIFKIAPKFIFTKADLDQIEEQFLLLQKQNYAEGKEDKTLNASYDVIKNEVKRLEYLMENIGIKIEDIKGSDVVLESVFNLREELENLTEQEVILRLMEVEKDLERIRVLLNQEFKTNTPNINEISSLFVEFKCFNEILKAYKR
jgi:hypothetical protein